MASTKRAQAPAATTVVYVHGILNKPPASVLKCQWDQALFGVDMGDRTRMAYWVNREYYPRPLDETCEAGDRLSPEVGPATRALVAAAPGDPLEAEIAMLTTVPGEQRRLRAIAARLGAADGGPRTDSARARGRSRGPRAAAVGARALPLPPFMRLWMARELTRGFLRDVHDFLFRPERREAMRASLRDRLLVGGGPFVVVAHSQGSMIAYDVLRELDRAEVRVPLLVTIGSPLGLDEVQDVLRQWTRTRGALPAPACVDHWLNVSDDLDPVAADHALADDFAPRGFVDDRHGFAVNPDWTSNPHSGTGYLRTDWVRNAVRAAVEPGFAAPVRRFVVARDLVRRIEDRPLDRHPTLIQLALDEDASAGDSGSLASAKRRVLAEIRRLVPEREHGAARIDEHLARYVSADLTREEVERLGARFRDLRVQYVWRNATKRTLVWMSGQRIQAFPAHQGYQATGNGIAWAVLDTGIDPTHPHFRQFHNVAAAWDCTGTGPPRRGAADGNGHGTHVAGIIAGAAPRKLRVAKQAVPVALSGMAPHAKLHVYKVLGDQGEGQDSSIIKALDHVARTNEDAGGLVIHGVNLSLGGSFDPSVFGCGHSPLCCELKRLWRSGVLVCIAAGNEGYAVLQSAEGAIESNIDLSIGDPANLHEAIAVGSVHKENPHTYGVSYFSSRGPTADGRRKPDVVAPGERILSARALPAAKRVVEGAPAEGLYVEMSGTSMAAPHVSGLLAAFLSVRREFIGSPDEVKRRLLESCTDLERDPYIQGHGLPNLLRMLASS